MVVAYSAANLNVWFGRCAFIDSVTLHALHISLLEGSPQFVQCSSFPLGCCLSFGRILRKFATSRFLAPLLSASYSFSASLMNALNELWLFGHWVNLGSNPF